MATSTHTNFKIGDIVVLRPNCAGKWLGVRWTIERFLVKNFQLTRVNGSDGRKMRAKPYQLMLASDWDAQFSSKPDAHAAYEPPLQPLNPGQIVTVTAPMWTGGDGFFVVLRDKYDKIALARLGGSGDGRYWPSVPRQWITEVNAAQLSITLTD